MRDIKFRGKDKTTGRLVYGWGCKTDTSSRVFILDEDIENGGTQVEAVQQFTGRLDQGKQDIYEGDIVQLTCSTNKSRYCVGMVD